MKRSGVILKPDPRLELNMEKVLRVLDMLDLSRIFWKTNCNKIFLNEYDMSSNWMKLMVLYSLLTMLWFELKETKK
ncbi:hypothetical protein C1H46_036585 [Malus baccata]|uniref:Uncharacterized protein n=1 Tax=Malus baccata TaxID=106549 RepID=A0A540NV27_MALBA|nr:hypothetical protein C1H46_036585 [Malus baccata]